MPTSSGRRTNPNVAWLESPVGWAVYLFTIFSSHILLAYILFPPGARDAAWTVTNVLHNVITLIFFHLNQSMPFADKVDHQGEYYRLTLWEQLDDGAQFSPTRKFLTAVPVLIFLLSIHMTNYDAFSFALNFISLLVVLVPKFPAMHGQRILGINKR